jgi:hypothetical protein
MVNDGLISALSRMENCQLAPRRAEQQAHAKCRQGSFEDIDLRGPNVRSWFARGLKRAAPLQCRWCHKCNQKLAFLPLV